MQCNLSDTQAHTYTRTCRINSMTSIEISNLTLLPMMMMMMMMLLMMQRMMMMAVVLCSVSLFEII